jgi:MFS family permease
MADAGVEGIRRSALRFVVLIGVVSLFADMTYEGARSIAGPFLATLGANGTVVGVVAGLGELIGYALRLLSGHLSDRTGRYWALTIWGYAINMLAVPLLALAGRWEVAAVLLIAERVGKAIRTPPRDVMLSHASSQLGRGWAFGVHEALDQIGAVVGPLVVAGVLMRLGRYDVGFAVLLVPALLALGVLAGARLVYPQPRIFEVAPAIPTLDRRYPSAFWVYMAAVACLAAGYADFPLIAFHFKKTALFADGSIPLLYALAMAVDAVAALLLGRLFDRWGLSVLVAVPLLSCLAAPFAFSQSAALAVAGTVLWGLGIGAQESVVRAAIAFMIPAERRGTAYGIFNAVYGITWFAGSALLGILYDFALGWLVAFSVGAQLIAVPILFAVRHTGRPAARTETGP